MVVVNNGNRPPATSRISAATRSAGATELRLARASDGENTIDFIHEGLTEICARYPEETIVKIDEDVLLVSSEARLTPPPRTFLVPNVTVNNFTTRNYLELLDPALAARAVGHAWMWHYPHPSTGDDLRTDLFRWLYTTNPVTLVNAAAARPGREVVAGADWHRRCLMADHPGGSEWRGISSTAMSFRGRDYLDATAGPDGEPRRGIEEVLIAEAVRDRGFTYTVDRGLFCHHINYFPVRPLALANAELLGRWHRLLLDHWAAPGGPVRPAVASDAVR